MRRSLLISLSLFSLLAFGCRSRFFNNPYDPGAESGQFQILKSIPIATVPRDLTFSDDAIWIVTSEGSLVALSYFNGEFLKKLDIPFTARGVTYNGSFLWVSSENSSRLYLVNPLNGAQLNSFDAPRSFLSTLAFSDGVLYAHDTISNAVFLLDASSGSLIDTLSFPSLQVSGIDVSNGRIWILDRLQGKIFEFSLAGTLSRSYQAPGIMPAGLTSQGSSFWNSDSEQKLFQFTLQ
jgi:outer membrane protein assembly factor BamB